MNRSGFAVLVAACIALAAGAAIAYPVVPQNEESKRLLALPRGEANAVRRRDLLAALQHRAAKMFTDLELARSCVEAALTAIDNDSPDVAELVSLAKAKVGDTLHLVSNEMVQMHGGIGMTDAHDAGFYLKRARAAEAAYGGQSYHRDRYARINGY